MASPDLNERRLAELEQLLARRDRDVSALLGSTSWRITKPLRVVANLLKAVARRLKSSRTPYNLDELPADFDRTAYLTLNPDVAAAGADPVEHYFRHGRSEGRVYSLNTTASLRESASLHESALLRESDPQERKDRLNLPEGFDGEMYLRLNPDVAASGTDPVQHYLSSGYLEGRPFSYEGLPEGFDRDAYLVLNRDVAADGIDPVHHYLTSGRSEGRLYSYHDVLPKGFDRDAYLALNPDVAAAGMNPAHHYLSSGHLEGRSYTYPTDDLKGIDHFRADRESVLVVCHEASRTGAPVVGLNLVMSLADRYNVVALLLGDGPLVDSFVEAGAITLVSHLRRHTVLVDPVIGRLQGQFNFKFALVNSIESRVVLKPLAVRFVPIVSLIHEFAAYTRPRDAFPEALLWSTNAVFSADMTRESALREALCSDASSVHTLPQGRCIVPADQITREELAKESQRVRRLMRGDHSSDGAVVVLGAGSVHLRKGVDLFVEVAARVVSAGANCRFVWFGNGYDPERDVHYSVYVADQIHRAGLDEHVVFAGETQAIETAYEEADLFLMSSRLDPMPNVAVDTLAHGKPVLCFDKATGIADFLKASGLGDPCVARYLDTADMADKVLALARSKSMRLEVGERGRDASASFFSMKNYVTRLEELAQDAADRARQEEADVEAIVGSALFRPDFSVPPDMAPAQLESAVRWHVRSWASGIRRRKPFPGFHPGVYLEQHGVAIEGSDPTADYIRSGRPEGPWASKVITAAGAGRRKLPQSSSVALHLHVFYPDLLPDIMSRISGNQVQPDLLVSVTSEEAKALVAAQLKAYEGNVAAIELVPNRGRDIGPLLTGFGRRLLSDYEYVGHIHTKKTADIEDPALGRSWFEFLLENLLGGRSKDMADSILSAMHDDLSLGMVVPDDPHAWGWTSNLPFARALADRLRLGPLPNELTFPVGTMFWARTSALAPLIDLNLQWDDYPAEPLPYDGSMLHAIERLLPLTLAPGTARVATTNVAGVTR